MPYLKLKDVKKDTSKLIKFYKGVVIQQIYKAMKANAHYMTVDGIDKEIKINADFPHKSCNDASLEDMQNLVYWSFVYVDLLENMYEISIDVDFPTDELDSKIDLNFNR